MVSAWTRAKYNIWAWQPKKESSKQNMEQTMNRLELRVIIRLCMTHHRLKGRHNQGQQRMNYKIQACSMEIHMQIKQISRLDVRFDLVGALICHFLAHNLFIRGRSWRKFAGTISLQIKRKILRIGTRLWRTNFSKRQNWRRKKQKRQETRLK